MSEAGRRIYELALQLTSEARQRIAHNLSVGAVPANDEAQTDGDIEAAWLEETRKRLALLESSQANLIPWEDARRRLFGR